MQECEVKVNSKASTADPLTLLLTKVFVERDVCENTW